MYIDLKDLTSPWLGYSENSWRHFNITPQDCRRRKSSRHWTDLDILLPEIKEEMFFSRSNIHLHLPDFGYWDELFTAVTYTRYAMPDDGGERLAARHAVGGKAVGLLEVINGLLGQTAEIAGDGTGVITQRFKVLLKGADGLRVGAVFQQAARRRAGTAA